MSKNIRVVLKDDVIGLGDVGETVEVKAGYARNFLIPNDLALEMQSASAQQLVHHMKQVEKAKRKMKEEAEKLAQVIEESTLFFNLKGIGKDKVFGSVGSKDIAEKLSQHVKTTIDRRRIDLNEPLRQAGIYSLTVKLHPEVSVDFEVQINVEGNSKNKNNKNKIAESNSEETVENNQEKLDSSEVDRETTD